MGRRAREAGSGKLVFTRSEHGDVRQVVGILNGGLPRGGFHRHDYKHEGFFIKLAKM